MKEDVAKGLCCLSCGVYFISEHGYPVLCEYCWETWTMEDRPKDSLIKATLEEVK